MTLTDAITGREAIATQMRARLAEQADRWGISMISVEIQDIKPEASVERAMNERRAAEENAERDRFELGSVDIFSHSRESGNPGALESRHRSHSGYSGFPLSRE